MSSRIPHSSGAPNSVSIKVITNVETQKNTNPEKVGLFDATQKNTNPEKVGLFDATQKNTNQPTKNIKHSQITAREEALNTAAERMGEDNVPQLPTPIELVSKALNAINANLNIDESLKIQTDKLFMSVVNSLKSPVAGPLSNGIEKINLKLNEILNQIISA